jgi:hypothetical protein
MTTRTTISSVLSVLSAAVLVALGASQAWGAEPSLKDKATYNQSVAALLGGISSVKKADASALQTMGDYLHKMVTIRQLREQIRTAKMANDMKAAENYYAKRKMNDQYRLARRPKRLKPEQLQQLASNGAPVRLATHELSQASARVNWPAPLCSDCFAGRRAELERLMVERTMEESGLGTRNCEQIQTAVAQMKSALKARVRTLSAMDYLAAKSFLERLAHEARFVAGPDLQAVASK